MPSFNEKEAQNKIDGIDRRLEDQAVNAVNRIEKIAVSVNAAKLFTAAMANLSIAPAEIISEATHGSVPAKLELLAYHLYPHFASADAHQAAISPRDTGECLEALNELFIARSVVGSYGVGNRNDPVENIKNHVNRHTKVVRGSAYPEQTSDEIVSVQGRFENWFAQRTGVGPTRAQAILWGIMKAQQNAVNAFIPDVRTHADAVRRDWLQARRKPAAKRSQAEQDMLRVLGGEKAAWAAGRVIAMNIIAPKVLPVGINELAGVEPAATEQEWQSLIALIGMTADFRKGIDDPIEVRQKPLFVLPDGRGLLADISHAMDVLWDEFEKIAKSDEKFFQGRYQRKKAEWLEERTVALLSRLFPPDHIYRGLTYADPANPGGTTELDAAVKWGPILILIEAKAKQFRMESQLGDVARLRTDIARNVEDAFEQARRAARYIDQSPAPEFVELSSRRKLTVKKDEILRTYLITVSQHNLAGLATRLATFQSLGLFKDGEYPLSLSIGDMEMVVNFCEGPDVFLHYIEKRLELQRSDENILADELDFFGAYLDTRLQPAKLWAREGKDFSAVWLSGWSDQFDDWMMYTRLGISTRPVIRLKIPDEIRDILSELRKHDNDDARWVAFSLLSMPDDALGAIAQAFRELRGANLTPGMLRRLTHQSGDTVISVVASLDVPAPLLHQRTRLRTEVEKYRRKAAKSIGFGVMVRDTAQPFDCAVWTEGPWRHDEQLENLLEDEPPALPAPGQKLPGRNEPCICGSGKKFKKCCLSKIEDARKGLL